jgi:F-type H+-transporting ATPase subunit b
MITPSITTFLITIINLGILFLVLRAVLFKRVTQFMEDRARKIEDAISQAEKDKNQAKQSLQQYEEQLRQVEGEADKIIRSARETGKLEAEALIAGAKAEAAAIVDNARKQIEAERRAAAAQFRAEAAVLVTSAAARLLEREVNREDHRREAARFLDSIAVLSAGAGN